MKLTGHTPLFLTPLSPHETLHPNAKPRHIGLTSIIQDLGLSNGEVHKYPTPMPTERQLAYSTLGALWEAALEQEFKARQGKKEKQTKSKLILQDKMCIDPPGIHIIPDGYIPKKVIHEYKLTFRAQPSSPERLLLDHPTWRRQTMVEAHVLKIFSVEFYVCWLGKWPDPQKYVFEFDKTECKEEFEAICDRLQFIRQRKGEIE